MGNGSDSLVYNQSLIYPVLGKDQFMLDDPSFGGADPEGGGPDGYTRWFNLSEIVPGEMPLFTYTQGNLATPGFNGTATLCPYKYFADGLGTFENLFAWLTNHPESNGLFSSGAKNDRNY